MRISKTISNLDSVFSALSRFEKDVKPFVDTFGEASSKMRQHFKNLGNEYSAASKFQTPVDAIDLKDRYTKEDSCWSFRIVVPGIKKENLSIRANEEDKTIYVDCLLKNAGRSTTIKEIDLYLLNIHNDIDWSTIRSSLENGILTITAGIAKPQTKGMEISID